MEPFIKHKGIVAPLDRSNIDTDAIIPKQFLRKIKKEGFGKNLFHEWRYLDYEGKKENPDFILNKPNFRSATILLTRENFGCGSSREHAPWALSGFGIKAIVSLSFADIFYNNCMKNGILLIKLKDEEINTLFTRSSNDATLQLTIDLENQKIGNEADIEYTFDINSFSKYCLVKGLDQINWTMQFEEQIKNYEKKLESERPWIL